MPVNYVVRAQVVDLRTDTPKPTRLRRMIGRMSVRELTEDERARERVG